MAKKKRNHEANDSGGSTNGASAPGLDTRPKHVFDPEAIADIIEENGYRDGFYRMRVEDPGFEVSPGVKVPVIEGGASLPIIEFVDDEGKVRVAGVTVESERHIYKLRCPGTVDGVNLCNEEWWPEQPYMTGTATTYLVDQFEVANRYHDSYFCPACKAANRPLTKGVRARVAGIASEVLPPRTVSPVVYLRAKDRAAFDIVTDPDRKAVEQYDKVWRDQNTFENRYAGCSAARWSGRSSGATAWSAP